MKSGMDFGKWNKKTKNVEPLKTEIMKKMTLLLAFLALTTLTAHAQHFDWVKTYMGRDINSRRTNEIIGSVVDSAGNLYILGHFGPDTLRKIVL